MLRRQKCYVCQLWYCLSRSDQQIRQIKTGHGQTRLQSFSGWQHGWQPSAGLTQLVFECSNRRLGCGLHITAYIGFKLVFCLCGAKTGLPVCADSLALVPAARQSARISSGSQRQGHPSLALHGRRRFPHHPAVHHAPLRCRQPCRPFADGGFTADQNRFVSDGFRGCQGRINSRHIMPVTSQHMPLAGFKPAGNIIRHGDVCAAVNRNAVIIKQNISLFSFRWPAREIASWLMPSIRQPSPAIT